MVILVRGSSGLGRDKKTRTEWLKKELLKVKNQITDTAYSNQEQSNKMKAEHRMGHE